MKWLFFIQLQTCCVYPAFTPTLHHHLHPVLSPQQELGQSQGWCVRGSDIFWQAGCSSDAVFSCSFILSPPLHLLSFFFFLSPSGSTFLRKIVPDLSEPLDLPRLSVAEETHSVLAAGLRTAHWTRLCRSSGMGRLLSCQVLIILNNYRE